eukprot:TRINITY_DN67412_c0_g1_i1.p1 TRINITY_DN67412_c0_g1~~TRINITY_DN67412_c0_g1_i1.p1  ORF type:complete len:1251 (+),score=146.17 TRINITY_DN67412_c0_g1_i1:267-4019(+)
MPPKFEDLRQPDIRDDEEDDKDATCSICSRVFIEPVRLPCSHIFDRQCILNWQQMKSSCPLCRAPLPGKLPETDTSLQDRLWTLFPDDLRGRHEEQSAEEANWVNIFVSHSQRNAQVLCRLLRIGAIEHTSVLKPFLVFPRSQFLPPSSRVLAYSKRMLPIPALSFAVLPPETHVSLVDVADIHHGDKVLVAGAGCGILPVVCSLLACDAPSSTALPALLTSDSSPSADLASPAAVSGGARGAAAGSSALFSASTQGGVRGPAGGRGAAAASTSPSGGPAGSAGGSDSRKPDGIVYAVDIRAGVVAYAQRQLPVHKRIFQAYPMHQSELLAVGVGFWGYVIPGPGSQSPSVPGGSPPVPIPEGPLDPARPPPGALRCVLRVTQAGSQGPAGLLLYPRFRCTTYTCGEVKSPPPARGAKATAEPLRIVLKESQVLQPGRSIGRTLPVEHDITFTTDGVGYGTSSDGGRIALSVWLPSHERLDVARALHRLSIHQADVTTMPVPHETGKFDVAIVAAAATDEQIVDIGRRLVRPGGRVVGIVDNQVAGFEVQNATPWISRVASGRPAQSTPLDTNVPEALSAVPPGRVPPGGCVVCTLCGAVIAREPAVESLVCRYGEDLMLWGSHTVAVRKKHWEARSISPGPVLGAMVSLDCPKVQTVKCFRCDLTVGVVAQADMPTRAPGEHILGMLFLALKFVDVLGPSATPPPVALGVTGPAVAAGHAARRVTVADELAQPRTLGLDGDPPPRDELDTIHMMHKRAFVLASTMGASEPSVRLDIAHQQVALFVTRAPQPRKLRQPLTWQVAAQALPSPRPDPRAVSHVVLSVFQAAIDELSAGQTGTDEPRTAFPSDPRSWMPPQWSREGVEMANIESFQTQQAPPGAPCVAPPPGGPVASAGSPSPQGGPSAAAGHMASPSYNAPDQPRHVSRPVPPGTTPAPVYPRPHPQATSPGSASRAPPGPPVSPRVRIPPSVHGAQTTTSPRGPISPPVGGTPRGGTQGRNAGPQSQPPTHATRSGMLNLSVVSNMRRSGSTGALPATTFSPGGSRPLPGASAHLPAPPSPHPATSSHHGSPAPVNMHQRSPPSLARADPSMGVDGEGIAGPRDQSIAFEASRSMRLNAPSSPGATSSFGAQPRSSSPVPYASPGSHGGPRPPSQSRPPALHGGNMPPVTGSPSAGHMRSPHDALPGANRSMSSPHPPPTVPAGSGGSLHVSPQSGTRPRRGSGNSATAQGSGSRHGHHGVIGSFRGLFGR